MNEKMLTVYLGNNVLGTLFEESSVWGFTYSAEWLTNPARFPVITGLKLITNPQLDGASFRPVQWFFDNLLPEENARVLLAKDSNVPVGDIFGLLTAIGAESAGAFTLLKPGMELEKRDALKISGQQLSEKIRNLPNSPMNDRKRKKMSLAGAQHKMLVIYTDDGQLLEPTGEMPSTHILKPEHSNPDEYYFTCRNEWFVMSLARLCKLPVPDVHVIYVPEAAYIVKRFDRKGDYPHQKRVHIIDGCQLLNIPHNDKYNASTAANLLALSDLCSTPAKVRLNLFSWAVFNALVGNGDAHMKNLSFEPSQQGASLTPHYDLLCTIIYAGRRAEHLQEELSQPMGNAKLFGELTKDDVIAFAGELKVGPTLASRHLDNLLKMVPQHADTLIKHVKSIPDAAEGKAGEIRMLREIRSRAITEMVSRLKS